MTGDQARANTDRLLWRTSDEQDGAYADTISVTEHDGILICVGGYCITRTIREWHALAAATLPPIRPHDGGVAG